LATGDAAKKMNKKETLKKLNAQIDNLIIKGKFGTPEYKRLCDMHTKLVAEMPPVK